MVGSGSWRNDASFSSYDAHGLRQLQQAHANAMTALLRLRHLSADETPALSKQVVDNLSAAYDCGVRELLGPGPGRSPGDWITR